MKFEILLSLLLLITSPLWATNEIQFIYDSSDDPNLYVVISRTTDRAEKNAQIESLTKANEDIKARLTAMESLVAKSSLKPEGGIK